jgi:hypothetical protein
MRSRSQDHGLDEPPPEIEMVSSSMLSRSRSHDHDQGIRLEERPPTTGKGINKLFGKFTGRASTKAPKFVMSENYSVEKFRPPVSEAADDRERGMSLPKRTGVIAKVDRFIANVIAPQVKKPYEYSAQ